MADSAKIADRVTDIDQRKFAARAGGGIEAVEEIGHRYALGATSMAAYCGHQYARQLDNPVCRKMAMKRGSYQPIAD